MKTISGIILIMAFVSIFGGLGLWAYGLPKIVAIVMQTYGCILYGVYMLMEDKITAIELETRNRKLYN